MPQNLNHIMRSYSVLIDPVSLHGNKFQSCWNRHAQESKWNTDKPLLPPERWCACKRTQELDDYDLEDYSASEHSHKHIVLQYAFEDVYLLHFPRTDLIESLKEDNSCPMQVTIQEQRVGTKYFKLWHHNQKHQSLISIYPVFSFSPYLQDIRRHICQTWCK